jgi:hypothetical protein
MNERDVSQALAEQENGKCEVKTPVGYIDVLTDKYVYEVKIAKRWKEAVGQVLTYKAYYPNHKPRLYLYGKPSITKKTIEEQCRTLGIVVVWHRDGPIKPRKPKELFTIQLHMFEDKVDVYPINVIRTYYIEKPPEPQTQSQLQTYLDRLQDILDPLLDNKIVLTLRYRYYGENITLENVREDRPGAPAKEGLVLLGETERLGREIKFRFPGLRTEFIEHRDRRFRHITVRGETLAQPLCEFVTQPGWTWKSSTDGVWIGRVRYVYGWNYMLVPSKRHKHHILKV